MSQCTSIFSQRLLHVERRRGEEEDTALFVALELLADLTRYAGVCMVGHDVDLYRLWGFIVERQLLRIRLLVAWPSARRLKGLHGDSWLGCEWYMWRDRLVGRRLGC